MYRAGSLLLAALLAPRLATAAELAPSAPAGTPEIARPYTVDLGAAVLASPRYPGSKQERVLAVPALVFGYRDLVFASVRDGLGVNLVNQDGFRAGPIARFEFGRYRSDDRRDLTGLRKVEGTAELGGFAAYAFGPYATLKAELRQGVNGHEGLVADLSADANAPPLLGNRLFLSAGPRLSFSDRAYNQAYFGVTPLESLRSGYAPYRPGGGLRKVGAGAGAAYLVSERITLATFGEYGRLVDDAARSPIVRGRGGSRDQVTVGTALTYRFTFGPL